MSNLVNSKFFGTSETLSKAFEHTAIFQQLILESGRTEGATQRMGYSQALYEKILLNYLTSDKGAQDKARLKLVFSLDNLLQANILIDWDKKKKRLIFSDHFISLVRVTTLELARPNSSIEFDGLKSELNRLSEKLKATSSVSESDTSAIKVRTAIFDQIRRIKTVIRENEVTFDNVSSELSLLSSGITHSETEFASSKRNMYKKANDVYEQIIKPSLEFLNPSDARSLNIFQILNEIRNSFEVRMEHEHVEEIALASLSLSSAYKPIEKVAEEVRLFLNVSRSNARAYNAFEKVSFVISDAVKEIKSLSLKQKTLKRSKTLSDAFRFLERVESGRSVNRAPTIQFSESKLFFKNMRLEVEHLLKDSGASYPKDDKVFFVENLNTEAKVEKVIDDKARAEKLLEIISSINLTNSEDLFVDIKPILEEAMPNYSFFDFNTVVRGMSRNLNKKGIQVITTGETGFIHVNSKKYQYKIRKLNSI